MKTAALECAALAVLALCTAAANVSSSSPTCLWTNFCHRLTYSRNQYIDRPLKSLVFYACNVASRTADCAAEAEVRARLDLVTTLQASQMQLTDIPRGLCAPELPHLVNIDLSGNRLNGAALANAELDECKQTNVTVLNLSNNQIDTVDLAHLLDAFRRLEVIYLDNCELMHIHLSAALDVSNSSLRVLSLSKNRLVTFDLNLLSLPSLEMIDLNKNEYANAPVSFVAFRRQPADSDADRLAQRDSIRLRRLHGVMQNRISDYYLTVNLHKANVAGMLEGLARVVTRYSEHDAAQTVRLISRFIDAFDYVRFDMVQAFTDCDSLCFFDETETLAQQGASLAPSQSTASVSPATNVQLNALSSPGLSLPLPTVLRFLAEHISTLKRIVSTTHYDWLMNLLSVRCASVHTASHVSISQVLASFDSAQLDQQKQDVTSNKIVHKLCGGFQHSRVRQFAVALRNALRSNATISTGNKHSNVTTEFTCQCDSCTIKYDTLQRSLVIAFHCASSNRNNFTLRSSIGDSLPSLSRIVSQALAPHWQIDWPLGSVRTNTLRILSTPNASTIPVHIDLNLTASGISQFEDYEPEFGHVRRLTLAGNTLRELDENLFRSMHSLRMLDLRRNELRALPSIVILALHELVDVRLEGNQLDCSCLLYTQLFEAQTLQVLHKLVDFNTLQCMLNNATGEMVLLTSVLRNLSNFLTSCPNIERVPVRLPRRPTTAAYALWEDHDTDEYPSISYLIRQFLSKNAPYILSTCAIFIAVLVILCVVCIIDYVKLYKARYIQVTQTDFEKDCPASASASAKRTATVGSYIRNASNRSCEAGDTSSAPACSTSDNCDDAYSHDKLASIDRLSLPKQHCEINEYLTNLVNENRHRDDFSRRSGNSECIPNEATSSSSGRKNLNLKNVTVILNDLQTTRSKESDSPNDWAVNTDSLERSDKNCLNFSTSGSNQDCRRSSNAQNDQVETEGELSDSARSDRADSEGVTDQSATLQQL